MKAEAMSFTFLGNEGIVKIPFFQRGYIWTKLNWDDMLLDLLDAQKSHFLGSLILKQQEKQSGKPKEVLVIDGQQRLTTLSVLLKSLFDSFPDEIKKNCENSIYTYLFYKKSPTDNQYYVKINHSRIDSRYYQAIIKSEISDSDYAKINDSSNRIQQCYKYYSEELKNRTLQEKQSLFDRLLDTENKIIVLIDLTEKEDEQAIFDTINSAGVRLSGADIIKNALFQKALELFSDEEQISNLYDNYWEKTFAADDEIINFWSSQRQTGRLTRDNVEILLHSIAVINGFFDPEKHVLSDLSQLYKNHIKLFDASNLELFLKEIAEYANLYRNKILIFESSTLYSFDDSLQRLLHILDVCEISTFHPFVLAMLYKHKDNETTLKDILQKLEKFIVRRILSNQETKSYNKKCKEFIDNEESIQFNITDDELLQGLKSINNKNASLLLFWVELFRRSKDLKQSVKELKYSYSLEHILPQKWEEYWSNVPN